MANIGTFTKTEQGFTGELVTLSLKAKNVRLVEEAAGSNENAPTHRVFVGRVEIGAAWAKRSNEARTRSAASAPKFAKTIRWFMPTASSSRIRAVTCSESPNKMRPAVSSSS